MRSSSAELTCGRPLGMDEIESSSPLPCSGPGNLLEVYAQKERPGPRFTYSDRKLSLGMWRDVWRIETLGRHACGPATAFLGTSESDTRLVG
jgi:hypothetical protein